ncbi:MAG: GNAT family N-acetyltransferase [bacterium]|nr:GNAT family N-acetyltransferase [bacterium]
MRVSFEEIHTEHLTLRIAHPETMDAIFALPSEQEQMRLLGIKDRRQLRIDQQKHKEGLASHNKKFVHFFLYEKGGNEVIGWCGYHTWYTDHNRAEIGYSFFSDTPKGKGWMSEAVTEVIKYGFEIMKLHRIEAMVGVDNIPSLRIMEKFGFQQEGHLREHYLRDGIYEDSLVFSLLAGEK